MPITKIIIENFKGIRDRVEIPIRPLTLLFGANSAGKTTVLHALLYLRELLERQNADADRVIGGGKDIYLGGFRQLVHGHNLSNSVTIGVEFKVDDDGCIPYPLKDQKAIVTALAGHYDSANSSESDEQFWRDSKFAAQRKRKQEDARENLIVNGVSGIETFCIELCVGVPTDDVRPVIFEYKVEINGVLFAKIRRDSSLLNVLEELCTRHPIFSPHNIESDDSATPPSNEYSEALEQALHCGHTLQSRESKPQVLIVPGSVLPSFDEALDFDLDEPDDEIDLRAFAKIIISQMVNRPGQIIRDYLRTYRHLGPIRSVPDLSSIAQRSPSLDRWIDGMAAWDLLSADAERLDTKRGHLISTVDSYLKDTDRLNLGYSLDVETVKDFPVDSSLSRILERFIAAPDDFEGEAALRAAYAETMARQTRSKLQLTDLRRNVPVNPSDIGAGVSQVIPVLVSMLDAASKVTAIEQPELHLHPAVQCSLGDLFVRAANKEDERFFFVETHSEHLLLRLMRRMRETQNDSLPSPDLTLTPETITIIFVETYEGQSIYREMPLNERGELVKAWPGGFFEEDMNELF